MAVDVALIAHIRHYPQGVQQLLAAEHPLGLFQQALQQAELMPGQAQGLATVTDLHPLRVNHEQRRDRLGSRPRDHALEDRLDPRRHFPRAEGLDHIIVGTDFQAHHPVDLAVPGTEEHHRHLAEAPQLLAGFEAADIRQADVEDDQVRRARLLMLQGRTAQAQPGGSEAFALQGKDQGVGNRRFVFDNQDMGHGIQARKFSGRTVPDAW